MIFIDKCIEKFMKIVARIIIIHPANNPSRPSAKFIKLMQPADKKINTKREII